MLSRRKPTRRKPARKLPVIELEFATGVIDLNAHEFEPAYKNAVIEALKPHKRQKAAREPPPLPDDFWCELADAVVRYFALSGNRRHRPHDLDRMRRILTQIDALGEGLPRCRTLLPAGMTSYALRGLWPVKHYIETYLEAHQTMSPAFRRNSDVHRKHLFRAIIELWQRQGRKLHFSPRGPLARFIIACVAPILGKAPGVSTMYEAVESAKIRSTPANLIASPLAIADPEIASPALTVKTAKRTHGRGRVVDKRSVG